MKIEISLDTKDDDAAMVSRVLEALWGESFADSIPTRKVPQPNATTPEYPNSVAIVMPSGEVLSGGAGPVEVLPEADDDATDSLPNPEGAPDVDSRGLPWDERIHAGTKATNADGSWRNKRGVDKALVESVEAELAEGPDEIAAATPIDPPIPNAPANASTASGAVGAANASEPAAGEVPLPPAPVAEASATIIPEAPASPSADAPTFKDAMAIVTTRQREGTLTQVQVSEAAQALGLSSVVDLAKPANVEHIAAFIALLG